MKLKISLFFLVLFGFGCEFPMMLNSVLNLYDIEQASSIARDGNYLYRTIRGNLIGNTPNNNKIERIDMTTGTSTVVVSSGLTLITDIVIHEGAPSMLYIADAGIIKRMNTSTLAVTSVIASGNTKFLAISADTLYAASDTKIFKIDLTLAPALIDLAGKDTSGYVNGIGAAAEFNGIKAITVVEDKLYVLDGNNYVRAVDLLSTGVTTLLGTGWEGNIDGTTSATFNISLSQGKLTSDGKNFLFLTDSSSVRKIDIAKKEVSTILNPPQKPSDIDGDISTATTFFPSGILYTPDRGLLISNFYGVRRLY